MYKGWEEYKTFIHCWREYKNDTTTLEDTLKLLTIGLSYNLAM